MPARLSAFVIWALVAAGSVFWGYRLWATTLPVPANVQTVGEITGARGDVSRLLGVAPVAESAAPPVALESSRFRLLGVLAPLPATGAAKPSAAGVALIAVDGKMARAYAVGARLDGELVLQSIARRSASIGPAQGAATIVLELPPPPEPSTGTLPRAGNDGEPGRVQAPMATQPPAPVAFQPPLRPQPQVAGQAQPADEEADDDETVTPPRRSAMPNPASR